ncbi:hypothetical protein CHUAL_012293 [Chamberlinius hualienensis]
MRPFATGMSSSAVRHRSRPGSTSNTNNRRILDDRHGPGRRDATVYLTESSYIVLLIYFLVLTGVALYVHSWEPVNLTLADVSANPHTFIEERARAHLKLLTSFGPRPTGSYENEVLAVDYIVRQAEFVKQRVKKHHTVEIDVQKVSGTFNLDFQDGFTSYYDRVQNVIVKLEPANGANHSVMVNCHYDSVPGSPGASDDAVSCAVMLEVLTLFSQMDEPFKHTIIFIFNGAEENILQASHGFITQHKWASKIKAFINLDSCGSGGRELLFQAGPENPWLTELYGRGAKYPFACILAQEIFQSGKIVPGDTDFRIFRDYGNIPGLDIAYIRNGYVYHTKFDSEEYIQPGCLQRAGENLQGLLKELANSPLVTDPQERKHGNVIFFDFFGLFLVVYTEAVGCFLMYAAIGIIVYRTFRRYTKPKEIGLRYGTDYLRILYKGITLIIGSWICALAGATVMALILELLGATMTWFSKQYLAVGLYLTPAILIIFASHSYFHNYIYKEVDNHWVAEQLSFESAQALWCIINTILFFMDLKTSMVLVIGVIFPSTFRFVGDRILYKNPKNHVRDFLLINLSAWALPLELGLQASTVGIQILLPLMGRTGAVVQPDFFIAVVFWIVCVLHMMSVVSFVHATRSLKMIFLALGSVWLMTFCAAVFTPMGHPYSVDIKTPAPQRFLINHVARTFHQRNGDIKHEDSGIWVIPADFNGANDMFRYIPELKHGHLVDEDCEKYLMCGMPFYYPALNRLRKSVYLPGPRPSFHRQTKLNLISQNVINVNTRRMNFTATGPSHMAMYMSPASGVDIIGWSFGDGKPFPSLTWADRPTYFIYYSQGEAAVPWTFSIDLKVPLDHPKGGAVFNIAAVAHYINEPGEDSLTPELKQFVERLPEWTYSMKWPATYEAWVY